MKTTRPTLLLARGILPRASSLLLGGGEGAGLLVEGGRVAELAAGAAGIARLRRRRDPVVRDLGDVILVPGLVNAHAHLELGPMAGLLPADAGFPAWVGALLRTRMGLAHSDYLNGAREGLARALLTGTTTLGDIDSTGAAPELLAAGRTGPRVRVYREVLDAWDEGRTAAALERLSKALPESSRLLEGYSPHAPFTVSEALLAGIADRRRRRVRPVAMHWSETEEELEWMERGTGGFAPVLGPSPRRRGLDLLEQAGLLGPGTSLIHGNLPRPGEPERIAAAGASVVHCPGTHRFFDRAPCPLDQYRRAGVNLALGTDSLASNEDLDLLREGRLLLESGAPLRPAEVLAMATSGGAQALGLGGEVGCLEPGYRADAVAIHAGRARQVDELAEGLFFAPSAPEARLVLLSGRRVPPVSRETVP
ncbi:MAG: amidohydrolase family protein [Planctomycetota bacterium]|nr:amidohydrolase family protein [Planctomycetota bacterium]